VAPGTEVAAVSVPKQRNGEPLKAPERLRVGDRHRGGELSGGRRNNRVWVNAFTATGITVDVSPEDAERFGLAMIAWARAASRND
jgi:hypothetical protein